MNINNINILYILVYHMAQPKKKMSKSRRDSRRANWKNKLHKQVLFAISLGKSVLSSKDSKFVSVYD